MNKIVELFKLEFKNHDDCRIKIELLLKELLIQSNISFHKIESRVKEVVKLEEKITRKAGKYESLTDITDLIGIRIITYFEDELDKIADIIKSEFILDEANSIDKRNLESDRFGYRSLHYIISLTDARKKLTEYKRFKNIKVEVQIRSVLQHAWAEIEHDLGYKGEHSVPDSVKRNFYRVAALLETADIEFVKIKAHLKTYEENVLDNIKNSPEDVELNSTSLKSFIINTKLIQELDKEIVSFTNSTLKDGYLNDTSILEKLYFLDIRTIKELKESLEKYKAYIFQFAKNWLGENFNNGHFDNGTSLFYLCYTIVGTKQDIEFADFYLYSVVLKNVNKNLISDGAKEIIKGGKEIIDTYNKIKVIKQ